MSGETDVENYALGHESRAVLGKDCNSPGNYSNMEQWLYVVDDGLFTEDGIRKHVAALPPERRDFMEKFLMDVLRAYRGKGNEGGSE